MNILNCGSGLLSSLIYLRKVEKYIDEAYYTKVKSYEKLQDLEMFEFEFLTNIENRLQCPKDYHVNCGVQREAYLKAMNGQKSGTFFDGSSFFAITLLKFLSQN